jgi:uncharacterized membrane protein
MKKLTQKYPVLGSSVNPDKLSLTVKSIGIALIPLFIAIGRGFGLDLVENDLVQLVNALATITSMVGVIIGVTRKIYN